MRALSRGVNSRVISAARSRSNKQPSLDESVQYSSQMRCLNDMTCRNSSRSSDRSCNFQHQYISRRTLFVEAAEGLDRMSEGIQNGLISIHQYTGLPWWATFAASTVLVRAALLPLARLQIIESRKFAMSVPEISFLVQLLRERIKGISRAEINPPTDAVHNVHQAKKAQIEAYMHTISVFQKGVNASFVLNNVSLKKMAALTSMNIAVFATFVFSVRDLIQAGKTADLTTGGLLWFTDLTVKDPMMAVLAVGASYGAIMISLGANTRAPGVPSANAQGKPIGTNTNIVSTNSSGTIVLFQDLAGTLIILLIPFVLNLPSGVFCYWIPSSMCGALQSIALRSPTGQALLRLPPMTQTASVATAQSIAQKHKST